MNSSYSFSLSFIAFLLVSHSIYGQCASPSNVHRFVHDGRTYEVIKEKKTWSDAAACAVERGGILAEINDAAENTAIYNALGNAGITNTDTTPSDGGGAAYVWIGGNDTQTEGTWVWDGDNTGTTSGFWSGTASGSAVNSAFTKWGQASFGSNQEPDDYNSNQDGLGIALSTWPYGSAGEWNDLNTSNLLYFVVEHSSLLSEKKLAIENQLKLVPNPVINDLIITGDQAINVKEVVVANILGQKILRTTVDGRRSPKINVRHLENGVYVSKITTKNDEVYIRKFVKK